MTKKKKCVFTFEEYLSLYYYYFVKYFRSNLILQYCFTYDHDNKWHLLKHYSKIGLSSDDTIMK